jgi:hypothetical protein
MTYNEGYALAMCAAAHAPSGFAYPQLDALDALGTILRARGCLRCSPAASIATRLLDREGM